MFVNHAAIVLECKCCKKYSVKEEHSIPVTPIGRIDLIIKYLNVQTKDSRCLACKNELTLVITKLECRLARNHDDYGNKFSGEWVCENGKDHVGTIYPIPLSRIDRESVYPKYQYLNIYQKVLEKGYPWKCPICGEYLVHGSQIT